MTLSTYRRGLTAARIAAAIRCGNIEDAALIGRINEAAAELHTLWSGLDRSDIEVPIGSDRASRIAALEREIDGLYAERRALAARAKGEALQPSRNTPEAR